MLVAAYDFELNHPCPLGLATLAKCKIAFKTFMINS